MTTLSRTYAPVLPVPEPDLTPDEMVARATAMRGHLRAEQAATEERTYYSEETHRLFMDAGFYRALQPRRYGGYEFGIETFYRIVIELARGCPSTGWCFCLGSAHVLQLATFFSDEAMTKVFSPSGHFIAASRDLPAGTVRPDSDGYIVEGTWNYCSGAPYSTHFIARAKLVNADGAVDKDPPLVLVIVPRDQWTMLDDWHGLLGMRGTGSHSIRVDHTRVPSSYVAAGDPFQADGPPPPRISSVQSNPIYNSRHLNFFHGEIASIMTGVAYAALDEYDHIVRTSKTYDPLPPGLRADAVDYQRPYGLALAKTEAAKLTVLGAARQHTERCHAAAEDGVPYTVADDLLLESVHGQAGIMAFDAIESLARMSGSSNAVRDGARMQRYLRDALVYRSHQQGASIEMMATLLAQERLKQRPA